MIRMTTAIGLLTVLILVAVGFLVEYYWLSGGVSQITGANVAPIATSLSVIVATLGIAISVFVSTRNSVKQHTINLLFQTRFSTFPFHQMREKVVARYPTAVKPVGITKTQFDAWEQSQPTGTQTTSPDRDLANALTYLANYYEFIAVGARLHDLDKNLLAETVSGNLIWTFELLQPFIEEERGENPQLFIHFHHLYLEWKACPPGTGWWRRACYGCFKKRRHQQAVDRGLVDAAKRKAAGARSVPAA